MRVKCYGWVLALIVQIIFVLGSLVQAETIDEMIARADNSSAGPSNVLYSDQGNSLLLEMDIIMTPEEYQSLQQERSESETENSTQSRKKRTAAVKPSFTRKRWTGNTVYYEINSASYTNAQVKGIMDGMKMWEQTTCIKFRQSRTAEHRIIIGPSSSCSSAVGMRPVPQQLGLSPGCTHKLVVAHEVGHALGLWHEQSRPDRDKYITIVWSKIRKHKSSIDFKRLSWEFVQNLGLPYDYKSIMHYGRNYYSSDGSDTMVTKDAKYQDDIGKGEGLSFLDIKSMNLMYNCKRENPRCTMRDSDCPFNGFVDRHCNCVCEGPNWKQITKPCPKCEDKHDNCAAWANKGECTKNPNWMLQNCVKSCSKCRGKCGDKNAQCKKWALRGECRKNPTWMRANCEKSCRVCTPRLPPTTTTTTRRPPPSKNCKDKSPMCKTWQKVGYCQGEYSQDVRKWCHRTCGVCY